MLSCRLRRCLSPLVAVLLLSLFPAGPTKAQTSCKASVLIDSLSGQVLSEVNSHEPLPPASMVKIMVAYVTLKQVKLGAVSWDDVVTTSTFASKMGGSQVYLKEGEQFKLQELFQALLIQSANDAAVAIAEHIGGTQDGFVELMNQQAKELNMNESFFHTAHGLPPAKGQQPDLVSANDMAILSRALLADFPEVLKSTGTIEQPFRGGAFVMRNHNHLLRNFPNCDGIKTGFYNQAGFCVSATAERNGLRLIAVVMGCKQRKERDAEAARLMSIGFAQYRSVKLAEKGSALGHAVPVAGGVLPQVVPVAEKPLYTVVKAGQEQQIAKEVSGCRALAAPLKAGVACGTATFRLGDQELGRVQLIVPEPIGKASLTQRLLRRVGL